jgi:hydroxyethylthiazole kinase
MTDPGDHLDRVRRASPLVHCIANFVAMNSMANALPAIGASPAMVHAPEEAAEFAGLADALAVNIGTPDPAWGEAMAAAAGATRAAGRPWVLDPVAAGATAFRRDLGARLVALGPTVIRGNASEILALAGGASAGRGADAADPVAAAEAPAQLAADDADRPCAGSRPVIPGRAAFAVRRRRPTGRIAVERDARRQRMRRRQRPSSCSRSR